MAKFWPVKWIKGPQPCLQLLSVLKWWFSCCIFIVYCCSNCLWGFCFVIQYIVSFLVFAIAVLRDHPKTDKTKVLKTNGSLMKVEQLQNALLESLAFLMTCGCYRPLPLHHGVVGWSAVCDCDIHCSNSLTFFLPL